MARIAATVQYSTGGHSQSGCASVCFRSLCDCHCPPSLQVVNYEMLIRRVMLRAPHAALLSVGVFAFIAYSTAVRQPDGTTTMVPLPNAFINSGEGMRFTVAGSFKPLVRHSCWHHVHISKSFIIMSNMKFSGATARVLLLCGGCKCNNWCTPF